MAEINEVRENFRDFLKVTEVGLLILTTIFVYLAWESSKESERMTKKALQITEKDFKYKNRPFLSLSVECREFGEEKRPGKCDLWIRYTGSLPAYQTNYYVWGIDKENNCIPLINIKEACEITWMNKIPLIKSTFTKINKIIRRDEHGGNFDNESVYKLKGKEIDIFARIEYVGPLNEEPSLFFQIKQHAMIKDSGIEMKKESEIWTSEQASY